MSSFTASFTGNSSVLQTNFFPAIKLDPNGSYYCALLDFTTYNSIPNIIEGKNNEFKFKYKTHNETEEKTISLITSMYEIEDILNYLKAELSACKISFTYDINEASSSVQISFDSDIEWLDGTVLNIIGFGNSPRTFRKGWKYRSEHIARIQILMLYGLSVILYQRLILTEPLVTRFINFPIAK